MATKIIYICDKCKKESEFNGLSSYELKTDYLSDRMYRAEGTQLLHVCKECAEELKKPFLREV